MNYPKPKLFKKIGTKGYMLSKQKSSDFFKEFELKLKTFKENNKYKNTYVLIEIKKFKSIEKERQYLYNH